MNAAGTRSRQANAEASGVFGVGARHERGRLLVAHLDEADFVLPLAKRFNDAVDAVSEEAEHDFDTPILKRVNEDVATGGRHGCAPARPFRSNSTLLLLRC